MTDSMTTNHVFSAIPTFFMGLCHEASQGEKGSYRWVGYKLARATGGLVPYSANDEKWATQVEELVELANHGDRPGVLRWFKRTFPKCLSIIPLQEKDAFVDGIFQASEEDRICV